MASPVNLGSVRSFSFVVDAVGVGQRLDVVLRAGLAAADGAVGTDGTVALTRARLQRMIVAGAVTVNGRVEHHPGCVMQLGFRVVCRLEPSDRGAGRGTRDEGAGGVGAGVGRRRSPVQDADRAAVLVGPAAVLFEDDWVLALNKPAGLPTHATADPRRAHLQGAVLNLLRQRPGVDPAREPYLGVHHRLDRDTSGVVLFSTHRDANAGLAAAFAGRAVIKQYLALCRGSAPKATSWTVRSALVRVSAKSRAARYGSVGHDATATLARSGEVLWAETDFEVLERRRGGLMVVRATPKTGRTHQIRVHLAEAGLPIEGDDLYGGSTGGGHGRVMLHAWQLDLAHPITGERLIITAPPPPVLAPAVASPRAR